MHEVEPQPIGRDQRARLLHVRAQHFSQRRVEQMRRRVVSARRIARRRIDFGGDDVALVQRAARQLDAVQPRHARRDARHPADVRRRARRVRVELADVRYLSARFEVERRLSERRVALGPFRQLLHLPPFLVEQRNHRRALHRRRRVSLEAVAGRAQSLLRLVGRKDELLSLLAFEGALRRAPSPAAPPSRARTPRDRR